MLLWGLLAVIGMHLAASMEVGVEGRELWVDGQRYRVKGVCYSPVPIGENPTYPPFGDYFTPEFAYIWQRDLPMIKAMGANTVRIYGWNSKVDHTKFLDQLHLNGLKAFITFYLGISAQNPVRWPEQRQKIIEEFKTQVEKYADHPAVLMWSFGNELNGPWNGFMGELSDAWGCGWHDWCMGNWNPWSPCFWQSECVYKALFGFINDAAWAAKTVSNRPVTSGFADLDNFVGTPWPNWQLDKVHLYESYMPHIALWAVQLYRGKSFGAYFRNFAQESGKPLLVTEYGVDAYNDPCGWEENNKDSVCFNLPTMQRDIYGGDVALAGREYLGCKEPWEDCAKPGVQAQAEWDVALTQEIIASYPENGGPVIGGFLMAWTDEYWKGTSVQDHCNWPCPIWQTDECRGPLVWQFAPGGPRQCSPHAHFSCNNYDLTYHDLCGYWLWAAPDHYVNEEWFGIMQPASCNVRGYAGGYNLDCLRARPVYYEMQKLWGGVGPAFPASQCADQLPCHTCLINNPMKHILKGACDTQCGLIPYVHNHVVNPWVPQGFWSDYGILILVGALFLCIALIWFTVACFLSRRARRNRRTTEGWVDFAALEGGSSSSEMKSTGRDSPSSGSISRQQTTEKTPLLPIKHGENPTPRAYQSMSSTYGSSSTYGTLQPSPAVLVQSPASHQQSQPSPSPLKSAPVGAELQLSPSTHSPTPVVAVTPSHNLALVTPLPETPNETPVDNRKFWHIQYHQGAGSISDRPTPTPTPTSAAASTSSSAVEVKAAEQTDPAQTPTSASTSENPIRRNKSVTFMPSESPPDRSPATEEPVDSDSRRKTGKKKEKKK